MNTTGLSFRIISVNKKNIWYVTSRYYSSQLLFVIVNVDKNKIN